MATRAAVVLLSGGLDSGTALALWREQSNTVALCLTFDYGQRSVEPEVRASARLAARFAVPWRRLELPWLREAAARAGCALVPGGGEVPERTQDNPGDDASAAAVWVPARNLAFLGVAASFAEALDADALLAGFNREEAQTFSDNSRDFVNAMNQTLRLATRRTVEVVAPTLALDKRAIVAHARRLGLDRNDFWSCYGPGPAPCERCESCVRRALAWGV